MRMGLQLSKYFEGTPLQGFELILCLKTTVFPQVRFQLKKPT